VASPGLVRRGGVRAPPPKAARRTAPRSGVLAPHLVPVPVPQAVRRSGLLPAWNLSLRRSPHTTETARAPPKAARRTAAAKPWPLGFLPQSSRSGVLWVVLRSTPFSVGGRRS